VFYVGWKNGFVKGALKLKDSKTTDEDYHREMDGHGFMNWFQKQLLPNLPQRSMIVMDNASYHGLSDMPKSSNRVGVMKEWLDLKAIKYPHKATKKIVWKIIQSEKGKHYRIDQIAKEQGHEVVRLPPYQCDLNPIELVSKIYDCTMLVNI
jgi:transposase